MKKLLVFAAAACTLASAHVQAAEPAGKAAQTVNPPAKNYLAIFVDTVINKTPGMPDLDSLLKTLEDAGMKPEDAGLDEKMLSTLRMMDGKPHTAMSVRLSTKGSVPPDGSSQLLPPANSKLSSPMALSIFKGSAADNPKNIASEMMKNITKSTVKVYWGSSEKVADGQPLVFSMSKDRTMQLMNSEGGKPTKAEASQLKYSGMSVLLSSSSLGAAGELGTRVGLDDPNWTRAYWPENNKSSEVPNSMSLSGQWKLDSSYAGRSSFGIPNGVGGMGAIQIISPNTEDFADVSQPVRVEWKPLSGCVGIQAAVVSSEQKNGEMIMTLWFPGNVGNADVLPALNSWAYLERSTVESLVKAGALLNGKSTSMTIPAGIFDDKPFASLWLTAYGEGSAVNDSDPVVRVQTRSTYHYELKPINTGEILK